MPATNAARPSTPFGSVCQPIGAVHQCQNLVQPAVPCLQQRRPLRHHQRRCYPMRNGMYSQAFLRPLRDKKSPAHRMGSRQAPAA